MISPKKHDHKSIPLHTNSIRNEKLINTFPHTQESPKNESTQSSARGTK